MRLSGCSVAVILAATYMIGCGGEPTSPEAVSSIQFSAQPPGTVVGGTAQFTAVVRGANGGELTDRPITWASSDQAVATVSSSGMVTGVRPGTATIMVTTGGVSMSAGFVVRSIDLSQTLSAGFEHTCGVAQSGRVYCWGANGSGQLGTSSVASSTTPVASGLSIAAIAVSAGVNYTCAITVEDIVYCWGGAGSLGDGLSVTRSTPMPIASTMRFARVSAGGSHTCAIRLDKRAYCWGSAAYGQLGTGTTIPNWQNTPVAVAGDAQFTSIATSFGRTCGVDAGMVAYCWGYNGSGALGTGTGDVLVPTPVAGSNTFEHIDVGTWTGCAVAMSKAAFCWGQNANGELGMGTSSFQDAKTPQVVSGGLAFSDITTSFSYSPDDWSKAASFVCGLTTGGAGYCWGTNLYGELGRDTGSEVCAFGGTNRACGRSPAPVTGTLSLKRLSAGGNHACGLAADGQVYCWGSNSAGQLGASGLSSAKTPQLVSPTLRFGPAP